MRAERVALPGTDIADSFVVLVDLVDLVDVAAVAARVLTEPGHEDRTYELTGPESLTFERAAAVIAAATDRDIAYETLTAADYAAELRAGGADESAVTELVGLFTIMARGVMDAVSDDIPRLLRRPARSFGDWTVEQATLAAWAEPGS